MRNPQQALFATALGLSQPSLLAVVDSSSGWASNRLASLPVVAVMSDSSSSWAIKTLAPLSPAAYDVQYSKVFFF